MKLRIASPVICDSIVDGPGLRMVIWTQGCKHNCKGCHNPQTHSLTKGYEVDTKEIINKMASLKLQQAIGIQIFAISGWSDEFSKWLPSLALAFGSLATISRLMRTSMLDVLSSDYIKTAKAKGLSNKTIVWRHAIRNAIMPVITVLGPIAASVLTGAFVVEKVFAIPGMGKFFVDAITQADYPMIAGSTLFYGVFLIIATLIVDILYGVIDPRVNIADSKE